MSTNPQLANIRRAMARHTYFNANQLAWAADHDWFLGVTPCGRIICREVLIHRDGMEEFNFASFTNMRELRAWAGY